MLMGGLTTNPQRSRQCAEMLRLCRKDAKDLPSYLMDSSEPSNRPQNAPIQPAQGSRTAATALEALPDQHAHAS